MSQVKYLTGNVLLIALHENTLRAVKPRLQAAGADPNNIFLLNAIERLDTHNVQLRNRPTSQEQFFSRLSSHLAFSSQA